MARRERLVVVGNGMASLRLLERLADHAPDRYDVTVVGAEPQPAYNRVLLSSLVAGEVEEEECRFRDRAWYLRSGIRLITGQPATALDLAERVVTVGRLTALPFDRLVLATGSQPLRPLLPGIDLPGVIAFRDLADAATLRDIRPGTRATVIGGGLLGLEATYGLAKRGARVTLVHLMDRLMERQLDAPAAGIVRRAMERLGIEVVLEARSTAILGEGRAEALELACGRRIESDLVVVAIGVRPETALAQAAGLPVGRGILVDDGLETGVDAVYALGECAEHRGVAYGLVEPAYAQAEVLARRLGGREAAYEGSLLSTTLKVSGVPLVSGGVVHDEPGTETIVLRDPTAGVYRKLTLRDGRLVGTLLVGDVSHGPWHLDLIRAGTDVSALRDDLMFGPAPTTDAAVRLAA